MFHILTLICAFSVMILVIMVAVATVFLFNGNTPLL